MTSIQSQGGFRITYDGNSHIGYNAHVYGLLGTQKSLMFGNLNKTPNYGAWGVCHINQSLNFYHVNSNNAADLNTFCISDGGVVGINYNPTYEYVQLPNYHRLLVNGTIKAQAYNIFSDSRLKDNITSLDSSLMSKLLNLNAVSYNFKVGVKIAPLVFDSTSLDSAIQAEINAKTSNPYTDSILHFGLIAQEVKQIFPNLVTQSNDGVYSLNYTELIPVLIKSIQDQQKQIQDLKAEVLVMKNTTPTNINTTKSVLYQNDPNPFNASTTFNYYIDESTSVSNCSIEIRELTGTLRATITLADQSGIGQAVFNNISTNANGNPLTQGFYVYTLKVNGSAKDSKMLLIE